MVKKKRIVSKLILALVVLTAISCCFLGSTFARYTSGTTGKATVTVAKWDVSFGTLGTAEAIFDEDVSLSPAKEAWTSGTTTAQNKRTHSTDTVKVVITNSGDVDAFVTVTIPENGEDVTLVSSASYADATGITESNYTQADVKPTQAQVADLFDLKVTYNEGDLGADTGADPFTLGTGDGAGVKVPAGKTLNLFLCVTWTSADGNDATSGAVADAIDTWAGKYVTSVAYTLNFLAVQDSELPAATA